MFSSVFPQRLTPWISSGVPSVPSPFFPHFFFLFVKRDNRFVNLVITCRNSRLLKPFSNTRSVNSFELIHTFHAFRRETVAITVHPMRSDPHSSFRYSCLQPVFLFSRLVCLNCLTRAYLRSSG